MSLTFGEKIKEARKQKNLTQKQLAELIGAAHNSISDWENNKNKPDPDTIELLCGVLKITPNYLLASTEDDFSPKEKLLIKKYRFISAHSPDSVSLVNAVLDRECAVAEQLREQEKYIKKLETYVTAEQMKELTGVPRYVNENINYVNAAHADDYANAPEELKQAEEDLIDKNFLGS